MVCSGHLRLVVFARHSSISDWGRTTRKNNEWICLVVVLLSGFALPDHYPNHNNQQCVGWRQTSRQHTAGNIGLIPVLELGLGLSAVEALHALSIAVACIQISITSKLISQTSAQKQNCGEYPARSAAATMMNPSASSSRNQFATVLPPLYVLIGFLFRKTNRNYGQVLTTVKYRLNVTKQTVHACVHPPYHDPPGVSAYCRLSSPSAAERCID